MRNADTAAAVAGDLTLAAVASMAAVEVVASMVVAVAEDSGAAAPLPSEAAVAAFVVAKVSMAAALYVAIQQVLVAVL